MNDLERRSIHINYLHAKDLYNQQPLSIPSAARLKIDLDVLWLDVTASLLKNKLHGTFKFYAIDHMSKSLF